MVRIVGHTAEHLKLVGVSLTVAIAAVAVPLEVLAFRRPRVGQAVLAVVGVIPRPVPGALGLHDPAPRDRGRTRHAGGAVSLLARWPRVGLAHDGEQAVGNSAGAAAGGDPAARGAAYGGGSILAGIKSAAVINVGTATLGPLIGAGGLGQPILTGIRLDDVGLVLEGAVPAAVLALLVQGLFDLAERALVSRGLRLTAED